MCKFLVCLLCTGSNINAMDFESDTYETMRTKTSFGGTALSFKKDKTGVGGQNILILSSKN